MAAFAVVPPGGPQSRFTVPHIAAQLLVKPAPGVLQEDITDLLAPFGSTIADFAATANIYVVNIADDAQLEAAIAILQADPRFEFAEPNFLFEAWARPNDFDFIKQWSKDNSGANSPGASGTPDADMNMVDAWETRATAPGVVIAIIDDGVETAHADLSANVLLTGKCFESPDSDPQCSSAEDPNPSGPEDFHGTLVAGAAAARGNNVIGIAGTVWETSILPLKVDLSAFAIVNAIDEAISQNADIINMSFGGPVGGSAQQEALNRAEAAGILVVAAAGNADANNDFASHYPSDVANPNVLAVAATTSHDRIAGFSQWAPFTVDVAAPGEQILSTAINGSYGTVSGTSFAAPHIAGIAALVMAETDAADYRQLKAHLMFGGVEGVGAIGSVTPGLNKDDVPGRVASGRIDAARALAGPTGGVLVVRGVAVDDTAVGNSNGTLEPGETALLEITVENLWLAESAVTAVLSTPDSNLISVNDTGPVMLGGIAENGDATGAFSVTLANGLIGNEQIFLQLDLVSATGTLPSRYFYLEVGTLENGATISQQIQRWDWDEFQSFHVNVPIGATNLSIRTSGSGDIDLLVREARPPEYLISLGGGSYYYVDSETQVGGGPDAGESISIPNPAPGLYHIVVVNYDQGAKTYDLAASCSLPGSGGVAFSAATFSAVENGGGATITVNRTDGIGAATVEYVTTAGSAADGIDYTGISGTLDWAIGETGAKTFIVPIIDDAAQESTETLTVGLLNSSGAALGAPASATLEIHDDDAPSGNGSSGGGSNTGGVASGGSGGSGAGTSLVLLLSLIAVLKRALLRTSGSLRSSNQPAHAARMARLHSAIAEGDVEAIAQSLDGDPSMLNARLPDV